MAAAADEEGALEKLPLTPGPVVPAREQLGELFLELNRPTEALGAFNAALALSPGSPPGLKANSVGRPSTFRPVPRGVDHMQDRDDVMPVSLSERIDDDIGKTIGR